MHWINTHGIECLIVYWVYCAAVGPMPAPDPKSSGFYAWLYGFLHGILQLAAANLTRLPGVGPMLKTNNSAPPSPPVT